MTVTQIDTGNGRGNGWRTTRTSFTPAAQLTVGKTLPLAGPDGLVVRSGRSGARCPGEPADLHGGRRPRRRRARRRSRSTPAGSTSTFGSRPCSGRRSPSATRYLDLRPARRARSCGPPSTISSSTRPVRTAARPGWRPTPTSGGSRPTTGPRFLSESTQHSSTFVITPLTSVTGQRVALSGGRVGLAGHLVQQRPRPRPSFGRVSSAWALAPPRCSPGTPRPNAGRYERLALARPAADERGSRSTPPSRTTFTPPHRALRQPGRLGVLLARPAVQGREHPASAPSTRLARLQQAVQAGPAAVAGRRRRGVRTT